jgi:hypothetical protein
MSSIMRHCHIIATALPCHCHVIATSLPPEGDGEGAGEGLHVVEPLGGDVQHVARRQGLTRVHFLAQRKRFLSDRECIWGCLESLQDLLWGVRGVFGGI